MSSDTRRRLPIAPKAPPSSKAAHLPLAQEVRPSDRAVVPEYVVWEITLRCDLACHHCGSRAGRKRPDELNTAEALDLVRQMAELGVKDVTLIGGEAYLREDWHVIAAAITAAGMGCSMTTGGRALTPERARMVKDAGIETVSVSVDGLEASHDRLRAVSGSYAAALRALENLSEVGVPVSVNTQMCGVNLREIEPLLELLAPMGIHSWQIQITVAMGRAADHPELLLQPWRMLELMPMAARIARRCEQLGVRLWPASNVGYFGPYEQLLRRDYPDLHQSGCDAGMRAMGIEANGDIKGCPSLPTAGYVGANIVEHDLRDIWERAAALQFNRERGTEDLWGHCASCYYAEVCKAGCTWTGHVLFGKRGNNPYCHHRALELLRQGRRERIELEQAAPGLPFDHGRYRLIEEEWSPELLARAREVAASGEGWIS